MNTLRDSSATLRVRRMGIDTYQEPVIYMREDCHVCRSEGFEAQSRVLVRNGVKAIVATLNVVTEPLLESDEAGFSEAAWRRLGARDGDSVSLSHPDPPESLSHVRAKVFGHDLDDAAMDDVVADIVAGRYSDIQLACFVTACAGDRLSDEEVAGLTRAMVAAGDVLRWSSDIVVDKHCVGGLPGNRTTPIIVPIVAACGLCMPKTSSRAITSPAGTADTMATLAPVDLDVATLKKVVEQEGGCIAWGGSVSLSPADDVIVRVERVLDLDAEGQLIASVLSKKAAAGSTHVVIDIPVGPTAKVRGEQAATRLSRRMKTVGRLLGLTLSIETTDGRQPVGYGIGPALEARDVLAVLQGSPTAPTDLRQRAMQLAGAVLDAAGTTSKGAGVELARSTLDSGRAWTKFQAICEAQGGMREPPEAPLHEEIPAPRSGRVVELDNRRLARIAKLAGAPRDPSAGAVIHVRLGDRVSEDQPLLTLHAESPGELRYALDYMSRSSPIFRIEQDRES